MTFLILVLATGCVARTPAPDALQQRVDTALRDNPSCVALALVVIREGDVLGVAAGPASPGGPAFTIHTPLRIASNTKTYVAAATLRLAARGDVDLDASISSALDPRLLAPLQDAGYAIDDITIRQLLMHSAGLRDHADEEYVARVMGEASRVWTPEEQVAIAAAKGAPLGAPGAIHRYSDTGYVLLGCILERATGTTLATVVRDELDFEGLGLQATWWEISEHSPHGIPARATQFLEGHAIDGIHGSADAFGGGGLMASVADMAQFTDALFGGRVFDHEATLALMRDAPGQPDPERYRMGVSRWILADHEAFGHSGFWGTIALHVPGLDVTIAAAVLDPAGFDVMVDLVAETVKTLSE